MNHRTSVVTTVKGFIRHGGRDQLSGTKTEAHRHESGAPRRGAEGDRARPVRRGLHSARHAVGQDPALAARACAHPLDRHVESAGADGRQGGDDSGRPARSEIRLRRPRARRREFLAHDAQHHGAREGALRGACHRCRCRDHTGHRRGGAEADRSRLRSAAARDRRRRSDEARCAAALRGHDHARHRSRADEALEHLEAHRIQDGRYRCGFRRRRRSRRDELQDGARASGLHRAARMPRARRRRRSVGTLGFEPGALRRAHVHGLACSA